MSPRKVCLVVVGSRLNTGWPKRSGANVWVHSRVTVSNMSSQLTCHSSTIDQTNLYTEISRTFFDIFGSNLQDESTSVFYIPLCGRIFNFGPLKYFGRKMLNFSGQMSNFVRQIFWLALLEKT